ncbi:MAG: hypothetical protein K6U00_13965 [Armatimonadetes bacterium]|nr:hypothetical protein [Armatimonadota bacterium]
MLKPIPVLSEHTSTELTAIGVLIVVGWYTLSCLIQAKRREVRLHVVGNWVVAVISISLVCNFMWLPKLNTLLGVNLLYLGLLTYGGWTVSPGGVRLFFGPVATVFGWERFGAASNPGRDEYAPWSKQSWVVCKFILVAYVIVLAGFGIARIVTA